jgi:hypothetical protein
MKAQRPEPLRPQRAGPPFPASCPIPSPLACDQGLGPSRPRPTGRSRVPRWALSSAHEKPYPPVSRRDPWPYEERQPDRASMATRSTVVEPIVPYSGEMIPRCQRRCYRARRATQLLSCRLRCDYRDEHVVLTANNMCATFIARPASAATCPRAECEPALSRTIITAGTTFLAALALFLFGGEKRHAL